MEPSTWYEWEKELLVCRFAFLPASFPDMLYLLLPFPLNSCPDKSRRETEGLEFTKVPREAL